ncbi:hypothetical protein NECAME_01763 [Necator americanus]|uniref:Uncharacterized protein n=1 Tax=Necator americanus TaxID=51031 RepID=W2TQQ7_NECAM|nr:hypothetical protein NECAME_01763 [Necator americanus]ETN83456.1 hypothetical protein NECAME_01763 [Necator americanus]
MHLLMICSYRYVVLDYKICAAEYGPENVKKGVSIQTVLTVIFLKINVTVKCTQYEEEAESGIAGFYISRM